MSRLDAVFAVTLMLSAGVASAQEATIPQDATIPSEEDWGTTSDIYRSVVAPELELTSGTEGTLNQLSMARTCAAGTCVWSGGIHLPSGAQIVSTEISYCDNSSTASAMFTLKGMSRGGGLVTAIALVESGVANTNGCTFSMSLDSHTVNNLTYGYLVQVSAGVGVSWTMVKVRYRLQVSPAPSVATFPLDVPTTHPFFRFVEAMAASGLTGGCATGRFCPDTPVTRGQLAVFLASALGLHFPN